MGFLASIQLQNIEKIHGPFGAIKIFSKKSLTVPKKLENTKIAKGILSMFSRFRRRFCFRQCTDDSSMFGAFVVQVEQMNKKVDL